jgi:hypothetical protein
MKFLQFPLFLGTIMACLDPDLEFQSDPDLLPQLNPDKKRCQEQSESF